MNLIYYGTANPGPWNADQRPGENFWTAGIFARDVDTGEAVWFLPTSPHDLLYIAGVVSNQPENAVRWIMNPPAVDAKTAMPRLGVTDRDARDMAEYLYSRR